jgi:aminoglycoside-2''-adenylyltransferase
LSTSISTAGAAVPEPVTRLTELMSSYQRPWSLCGGWAVDAWLGHISRDHGDVDLSVFDADHQQLVDHLAGWQLIAHTSVVDDVSTGLWDGRRLPVPSHIHARSPADAGPIPEDGVCEPAKGWWLDIQIDGAEGGECVLRQEPRVALPMSDAIRTSPWLVPCASPEVLLFFKAALPRRRDWRDFVALLPRLDAQQIAWLRDAIALAYPEHPWIDALSWTASMPRSG